MTSTARTLGVHLGVHQQARLEGDKRIRVTVPVATFMRLRALGEARRPSRLSPSDVAAELVIRGVERAYARGAPQRADKQREGAVR